MTDRDYVKSAHRPRDPLGPWLAFHPANIPCDECASESTGGRVKPWDAERCEASAKDDEANALETGHPEFRAYFRERAATYRAYAAALRLLDSLDTVNVQPHWLRDALAKALRGEEGE